MTTDLSLPAKARPAPIGHPPPGVQDWSAYALVIDARSPREYADDHVPGAVNLPVVDDLQYAEVGTTHRTDKHAAYLIGVEYSLRNIAARIRPLIAQYGPGDRFLVYCFRGGKRSRLWADSLRTIGFEVDVLPGGWKAYRQWVRDSLAGLSGSFAYRVLCGPTGCGKTRLLGELARQGHQVLDLEQIAGHRGSLLGDIPGQPQPSQKLFDSAVLAALRSFDPARPVWLEAESKKIGALQIPEALFEAMRQAPIVTLSAPMPERVRLWREDYPHFAADPVAMVERLEPLKPLVGKEILGHWHALAAAGQTDALFESIMSAHYDPCYVRSNRRNHGVPAAASRLELASLGAEALAAAVPRLVSASESLDGRS